MVERHLRAILALPFTVLIVIPVALVIISGTCVPLWGGAPPLNWLVGGVALLLIAIGLSLIVTTIRLFVEVGRGTLAPWDETETLVVVGPYRYVRNPMISGVIFTLFGESLLCGCVWLLGWALFFTIGNLIYIPLSEEKGLEARFGANYRLYKRSVPRWIPSFRPWEQ